MTTPSTKVPTAREAAIAAIEEAMLGTLPVPFGVLSEKVETLIDAVTAAIEARDTTLRSAVEAERDEAWELLWRLRRYEALDGGAPDAERAGELLAEAFKEWYARNPDPRGAGEKR